VDGALAVIDEAVQECLSVALWARTPEQVVGYLDAVQVVEQRLAGLKLHLIREIDNLGVAQKQGAASTVSWLRDRHRVSGGAAKRSVDLARALDTQVPTVSAAVDAGAVTPEQARIVVAAVDRMPGSVKRDAERCLVGYAATFGPKELGRLAERILEHAAPDLAAAQEVSEVEQAERDAHARRELSVVDEPGTSRVRVHGWLDREAAAVLRAALDPLSAPHRGKDEIDLRTAVQRRADALVEVCHRVLSFGKLPDVGGQRPHLVVTVDYDKLRAGLATATLDDGGFLSAATVRRLACDAGIIPIVMKGAGQVLDIGRDRRLFSGHLRRALVARDRGCAFPACDKPARYCDGHHARHWVDGGVTALHNAVLLCRHHHRVIHEGEWHVRIVEGLPQFIPPDYIDPEHKPLTNTYHRRR
jgi:hypothetical protein